MISLEQPIFEWYNDRNYRLLRSYGSFEVKIPILHAQKKIDDYWRDFSKTFSENSLTQLFLSEIRISGEYHTNGCLDVSFQKAPELIFCCLILVSSVPSQLHYDSMTYETLCFLYNTALYVAIDYVVVISIVR